jgi:hypothetical protein
MQKATESLGAEIPVMAREQDKDVPQIIHHLRRHGDEPATRPLANLEILLQSFSHQRFLRAGKIWMLLAETSHHGIRHQVLIEELPTGSGDPLAIKNNSRGRQ